MAGVGLLTAIGLLLMVGAAGKSAQIPLYVWLPDAMEGPTPVSALIHAATMVTAGVYMVARSHVIFDRAPMALTVVAIIGTLTALFAATIGIAQTDIKKVLAYSTVSQLGYMFMACGVAAYSAGIFHLMTHAFFKGLLFLGAGSVIHAVGGEQDMRKMGGLRKYIPVTFWTMTIAHAGDCRHSGLLPDSSAKTKFCGARLLRPTTGLLGRSASFTAFLTSFYMFRLWFMTFLGEYRRGTRQPSDDGHGMRRVTDMARPWRAARESVGDAGAAGDSGGAVVRGWLGWHSAGASSTSLRRCFGQARERSCWPIGDALKAAAPETHADGSLDSQRRGLGWYLWPGCSIYKRPRTSAEDRGQRSAASTRRSCTSTTSTKSTRRCS